MSGSEFQKMLQRLIDTETESLKTNSEYMRYLIRCLSESKGNVTDDIDSFNKQAVAYRDSIIRSEARLDLLDTLFMETLRKPEVSEGGEK